VSKSQVLRAFARANGLVIRFWANERGHAEAPHFHVRKEGKWEIKVRIDAGASARFVWEIKWQKGAKGPDSKLLADLAKLVDEHRATLLDEWDRSTLNER
jgi:hypothetical protein